MGHLAFKCQSRKSQKKSETSGRGTILQMVHIRNGKPLAPITATPLDLLYLSSEDESTDVRHIVVPDGGSQAHCTRVTVQGVPTYGVVDTAADITIMGDHCSNTLQLLRDFHKPDKTPHSYVNDTFKIDGMMKLEVAFDGKMGALEQLLLSEGVCRQTNIIMYHKEFEVWCGQ